MLLFRLLCQTNVPEDHRLIPDRCKIQDKHDDLCQYSGKRRTCHLHFWKRTNSKDQNRVHYNIYDQTNGGGPESGHGISHSSQNTCKNLIQE